MGERLARVAGAHRLGQAAVHARPVLTSFESPEEAQRRLTEAAYLADDQAAMTVFLADRLEKPILCEGPAGVGKTELAKALARTLGRPLIRLQCYEGLDEAKALYEWNYKKQLLRIQADAGQADWARVEQDIFAEEFLLPRPLLAAIRSPRPAVLLIDEVDRLEVETEALLLEVLADWQVSIPELGTMTAGQPPLTVLTSNSTRELSEALRRRCLFLPMSYPSLEREAEIIRLRLPDFEVRLGRRVAEVVRALRSMDLKKPPSISETLDWARTLSALGLTDLDGPTIATTLPALLKHRQDIDRAVGELGLA